MIGASDQARIVALTSCRFGCGQIPSGCHANLLHGILLSCVPNARHVVAAQNKGGRTRALEIT